MKQILFVLIMLQFLTCTDKSPKDHYPYTFKSIKNFNGTPVEKLSRHVKNNDTLSIISFLKDKPTISIDTKDKYFGYTLLMWAIYNGKYEAFHCLLEHGANPNFEGEYGKETPLCLASTYIDSDYERDARYCKELLEHGADPNKYNPLKDAVIEDIEYTKLLVEYGANYNKRVGGDSYANLAIIQCKYDIAEFLIIEKKAVLYSAPFYDFWDLKDPNVVLRKKQIEEYLNKHPEQLKY